MALNTTLWRTTPQWKEGYLYIHHGTTLYSASVNQGTFQYPISSLVYDGASGVLGSVKIGQTIEVNDSGGNFKGYCRVRDTPGGSVIYINELSQGEINFADNDQIRVLDEFRLWAKTPRILPDGNTFKDYDLTFTNARQQGPVANAGPSLARNTTGGSILVNFNGTSSIAFNGSLTYAWNFGDGTPSSSTSGTVNNVSFPPGARYISLTVTDGSSQSHTAYALIAAVDGTILQARAAQVTRYSQSLTDGTNIELELQDGTVDSSILRNGAPLIYYEQEYYNGTLGLLSGYPDREDVKFVGWHDSSRVSVQPYLSNVSITASGPLAILKQLPAYPQVVERVSPVAASWQQMTDLDWWRFWIYIAKWHTTALELFDIERPAHYNDYPVTRLDAIAGSPYDQLQDIARAVGGNFTADRTGRFYVRKFPHFASDAYRNSLNTIVAVGSTDWVESVEIPEQTRDVVGWVRSSAIQASTSSIIPLLAAAPGNAPSQGGFQETFDRQLVVNQSELNQRTGDYYSYRNRHTPQVNVTIANQGGVVDPALQEWIGFTLASTSNRRGLSFDGSDRFTVAAVDISHDNINAVALERWTLEPESNGVDGVTVPIPNTDDGTTWVDTVPDTYSPPPSFPDITTPVDVNTEPESPTGVAVAWGNPTLITTQRQAPGWTVLHDPAAETSQQVVGDEFCPYYTTGLGTLELYILTDAALYYAEDCLGTTPVITNQAALADYTILRLIRGAGGSIAAYGPSVDVGDQTITLTFDGGSDPSYVVNQGTVGAGGRGGGNGLNSEIDTGNVVANVRLNLGAETTLQSFNLWVRASYAGATHEVVINVTGYESDGTTQTGTTTNTPETTTPDVYTQITYNSLNWANTQYIEVNCQNPTFVLNDFTLDDLASDTTLTGIAAGVYYSNDYGDTGTVTSVGASPTQGAMDVDDFGGGVIAATNGTVLRHTTTYAGAFNTITGPTSASGSAQINCLRIPYRTFDTNALNNNMSALHMVWGMSAAVSGNTLWRGQLNKNTSVMGSIVAVTPNNGTENFVPIGPNSVEVLGSNAQVWLGLFEGTASGNRWLCLTEDAGSSWQFLQQSNYSHVQWSTVGGTSAWMGGVDGIGRTPDRATTLEDRTGDAYTVSDITLVGGVFSIG